MTPMLDITDKLPVYAQPYGLLISMWATAFDLDPFVLAALGDRETLWGTTHDLDVPGPTGRGDDENGVRYGHGLMQIDSRTHASLIAAVLGDGTLAWKSPMFNIGFGASILAADLKVFAGSYPAAICSYNAGPLKAHKALSSLPPDASISAQIAALDVPTADGNYVSDVLSRRARFAGLAT